MNDLVLQVDRLSVQFRTRTGVLPVLDRVSFDVRRGETVGVVGESGSGKSVTAYASLGLLDANGEVTHGQVRFDGRDLLSVSPSVLKSLRGRDLAMIFQNPRTALNPIRSVGLQIEDVLACHSDLSRKARREAAIEQLARVKITDPARRYHAYPFELSGGMCQRVMIAIALACKPRLLIADEPTTGIDVTTQVVIMDLMQELAAAQGMATLLITHDLGLAMGYCQRIVVMHAGQVLESAPTAALFNSSMHPYTRRLIAATPHRNGSLEQLSPILGQLPNLRLPQPPCRFSARCDRVLPDCHTTSMSLRAIQGVGEPHYVACENPL